MNQAEIVVRPATEIDAVSISALLSELGYPLEVALVEENLARKKRFIGFMKKPGSLKA